MSEIKTEDDITSEWVRGERAKRQMKQREFWEPICLDRNTGSFYEKQVEKLGRPLPRHVRRLLFLHYVIGIPVDNPDTLGFIRELMLLDRDELARAVALLGGKDV